MHSWFVWLETSALGTGVNNSTWAFAVLEAGHLLSLALLGGATLAVDLRLLGWAFPRERVRDLALAVRPFLFGGLAGVILTGVPLLASLAAQKYYPNPAFWLKMYFFVAAVAFTFTLRRAVVMGNDGRANSVTAKLAGLVSVVLWAGVGIMGRGIGFY